MTNIRYDGIDMNAPKVSYHMFIFWSRDKFFVNLISRSVVGGALEVVLVAAAVLWFVMVGGGGYDKKRKSLYTWWWLRWCGLAYWLLAAM